MPTAGTRKSGSSTSGAYGRFRRTSARWVTTAKTHVATRSPRRQTDLTDRSWPGLRRPQKKGASPGWARPRRMHLESELLEERAARRLAVHLAVRAVDHGLGEGLQAGCVRGRTRARALRGELADARVVLIATALARVRALASIFLRVAGELPGGARGVTL